MYQDVLVEGESFLLDFDFFNAETLVVDSKPVPPCQAHHAPIQPPTQWKAISCLAC